MSKKYHFNSNIYNSRYWIEIIGVVTCCAEDFMENHFIYGDVLDETIVNMISNGE